MERHHAAKPVWLLAGGPGSRRRGGDPLLAQALSLAGRDSPSVAYVGAPSGDNRAFFIMIAALLKKAGAGEVTLVRLAGRKPDVGRARDALSRADVVVVTGGDVEEGMRALEATDTVGLLGELAAAGKPFIGVSAGSIMLARAWVRWRDPDDESTAETFPCLGIAPVVCDTHGEAEGWEELAAMVAISGEVGHGIPTGAGLVAHPDGSLEAAGAPINRFERRGGRAVAVADLEPPLGRATAPPGRT
jgi:putative intracellular protease/amidase